MALIKIFKKNSWRSQSRKLSIDKEVFKLGKIFKDNLVTMLISAFGFVAALQWNQAIQEAIKFFFPEQQAIFYYKLLVAFIVTFFSVLAIYFLSKFKGQQ